MIALQRVNSYSFLLGYLGFLASWILDTVYALLRRSAVKTVNDGIKSVLMVLSPHYNLARWVHASRYLWGHAVFAAQAGHHHNNVNRPLAKFAPRLQKMH